VTEPLVALGLDDGWRALAGGDLDRLARVSGEQRGQWEVITAAGRLPAVLAGRWQHELEGGADRPAVGDWVVLRAGTERDLAVIEAVLPRRTRIARKAAGRETREQVVAANVDVVFVVTALGRDVNERRLERFTAIVWNGGAVPEVVLNKVDLVGDAGPWVARAMRVAPGVAVHAVSALSGVNMAALDPALAPGRTVALLGTSGAGKSTLVNRWLGRELQSTGSVGDAGKGRHTTTTRQLLALPSGAVVIDTPGLREVGLWTGDEGLAHTFEDLAGLATGCRFSDCRHQREPGCAIAAALAAGAVDESRLDSWRRLTREQEHVARQFDPATARHRKSVEKSGARALRAVLKSKGRAP
jgi:ribosome biogenesis GTPase